ncbi:tyrosine-type recombinase/integrase [Rheinheimera maricola]|uniref:Integrase arm-type DNA-binding domain-containing protein n=1 Tax=Rheinheimera maricola TaxID=2793282 RepID=A0ABS7XBI6_9GAMM|nr:integrase arm-type DNA-binding domain-containing protein [Rheinheimera maricola]MBZ9612711.1 integrase arm-type DNA-binding domain-containing protein [Rheinheimera maricola]
MAMKIKTIDALEPAKKPYKKHDGKGLYLVVYPSGTKVFRLKYFYMLKENTITLGKWGKITLKEAREKAEEFRLSLRQKQEHLDPLKDESTKDSLNGHSTDFTFGEISALWLSKKFKRLSIKYRLDTQGILERHILPTLRERFLSTIRVKELYDLLSSIQDKGLLETGVRAYSIIDRVYRFAAAQGYEGKYPCPLLKGQLDSPKVCAMPAATDEFELTSILQRLDEGNRSTNVVMLAIRCSFHWFCRPIELRTLQWSAVNFALKRLELVAAKSGRPHLIPLTAQTLELLEQLKKLAGDSPYIFQSPTLPDQPISENTCNNALRLLGIKHDEMVMHGVRATAMTLLRERFKVKSTVIRLQLGHTIKDKTGRAYDRSRHLKKRRVMMRMWSQFLVDLTAGKVDLSDLIGDI